MHDQLDAVWKAIGQELGSLPGTYQRRIPESGVLTCYAALVQPEDRRKITVRVTGSVCSSLNLPAGGKGFELFVEPQTSGDLATLHLEERSGTAMFSLVCADLIMASKAATDIPTASLLFCSRLIAWKRFFESKGDLGITREEYIGLWGELHIMNAMIDAGTPAQDALRSWLGPTGAPQDFSFGQHAFEVKTSVGAQMSIVDVSNVMQLDGARLSKLYLICCHCDFRPNAGITMSGLRDKICSQLSPALSSSFQDSLISRGLLDPDSSPWNAWGFTVLSERAFEVKDSFPRLRVNDIPSGVVDVTYSIQLGACSAFRVEIADALQMARFGDPA